MMDEWNEQLRCPRCRKTGMAGLSQNEGVELPTVDSVPDGFTAFSTEYGPDFRCDTCDVEVNP
jgi:hypothetical protein